MILYRDIPTPLGTMRAFTGPAGLMRLTLPGEDGDDVARLIAMATGDAVAEDRASAADVADQLAEYFAGTRTAFTIALDLSRVPGFRGEVLEAMARIPHGATVSYAELARAAGRPTAVRAAGSACATNPVPVIVPCHRVVRSDGRLGNYGGGVPMKRDLLRMEGVTVAGDPPRVPATGRGVGAAGR